MPLTGYDKAAVSGAQYPYRVCIEIQSDDDTWCEITRNHPANANDPWYNRLLKRPTLRMKSEVRPEVFATSISNLIVNDHDGLFGGDGWALVDSTGAEKTLTSWYRAILRVRIGHHVNSPTAWTYASTGTFLIEDVKRNSADKTALIELVGREKQLMDVKTSDLKRGDAPPVNIPLPLLVEELVRLGGEGEISMASGSPPGQITIETDTPVGSVIGNVPCANPDGSWNEDQNFVSRYVFKEDNYIYHFGYTKTDSKPAAVRHNTTDDSWTAVASYNAAGYEIVFAVPEVGFTPDEFYAIAITNEMMPDAAEWQNHKIKILTVNKSTCAIALVQDDHAWMCNALLWKPVRYGYPVPDNYYDYNGRFKKHLGEEDGTYNPPTPFPSIWSMPDHQEAGDYDCHVYAAEVNDETNLRDPRRFSEVLDYCNYFGYGTAGWSGITDALSPGYYCYIRHRFYPSESIPLRTPTHPFAHEAFKYDNVRGYICWMAYDHDNNRWTVHRLSVVSGLMPPTITISSGSWSDADQLYLHQVTAFCPAPTSSNAGHFYIATIDMRNPQPGETTPQARVRKFDYVGSVITNPDSLSFTPAELDDFDQDDRYCLVYTSIYAHKDLSSKVWGQVLNIFAANTMRYGFWHWQANWPGECGVYHSSYSGQNTSPLPISPSPFAVSNRKSTGSEYAIIQDQGTGALWGGDPHNGFEPLTLGMPIDGENTWASSNIYCDANGCAWGVSASNTPADCRIHFRKSGGWPGGFAPLGAHSPGGRMSFWRYALDLLDNIRVGHFGDTSVWNALEMCREYAGDYVMHIDTDGDMRFDPRPTDEPTLTLMVRGQGFIPTDGTAIAVGSLESSYDHKGVRNCITIPVYEGTRAAPVIEMVVNIDPESDKPHAGEMIPYAGQLTNKAQRIVLRCISEATLQDSSEHDSPLLFAWRRTYSDLSTSLSAVAAIIDATLYVYGLWTDAAGLYHIGDAEIKVGDSIRVGDGAWILIDSVNVASGSISLAAAVGGTDAHARGSTVTIRPQDKRLASDSQDGVCTLTAPLSLDGDEFQAMSVDSTALLSVGMLLQRDTSGVEVVEILSSTSAQVRCRVLGGTVGQRNWLTGDILKGAIWFKVNGKAYNISNTGVAVSLTAPNKEVYRNAKFTVGDRITVTCAGLQNRKVEHAVFRTVNSASVKRYKGKKEWKPRVENVIMTHQRAQLLLTEKAHLAWPSWLTIAKQAPLILAQSSIGPGATLWAKNPHLWPNEDGNRVAHHVLGWKMDLENGTMELTLRSVSSTLAAGPVEDGGVPAWARHDYFARKAEE